MIIFVDKITLRRGLPFYRFSSVYFSYFAYSFLFFTEIDCTERFVSVIYCHITHCPKLSGFFARRQFDLAQQAILPASRPPWGSFVHLCSAIVPLRLCFGLWLVISWGNRVSLSSSQRPARRVSDFQEEHRRTSTFPAAASLTLASQVQPVGEGLSRARDNARHEQIGATTAAVYRRTEGSRVECKERQTGRLAPQP